MECSPADAGSGAVTETLDALWSSLESEGGVGLAAPQLGIMQRVLIVWHRRGESGQTRLEMINPVVRETFGQRQPFEEGCLSFPGLYSPVWRQTGIEVEFFDRQGACHTLRDNSLVARIIKHEIDHLDGHLFIDHLSFLRKVSIMPRLGWIRLRGLSKQEAGC